MQLTVSIPTRAQIVNGGFVISISTGGATWSKSQLGDYADKSGVHVIHANGCIIYVGKTTEGDYGTFGERLRRHCQKKASSNSQLYQALCAETPLVRAYLLDLQDLDMMIDQGPMSLSQTRIALIMEQVLIGIYEPPNNRV